MTEFSNLMNSPNIVPVTIFALLFGLPLLISLAAIISQCVRGVRRDNAALKLKQDMLDRGMSAEEIKMVLEAGPKR